MTYKILTQIGGHYHGEDGLPSPYRFGVLMEVSQTLQQTIRLYNAAKVATPPPVAGSVKSIKAYYEAETQRAETVKALEQDVFAIRRQLARLGAVADVNGRLDAGKSAKVIHYDSVLERELTRISVLGGVFRYTKTNKLLDTTKMTTSLTDVDRERVMGNRKAMYVMSAQGNFHVGTQVIGQRHHSTLLGGGNVACAGEMEVQNGTLLSISNDSGHYQPDIDHFLQVLHQLVIKNGVSYPFRIKTYDATGEHFYSDLAHFMTTNGLDNDSYDYRTLVRGYGAYLNVATLGPKGWEFRPHATPKGVYDLATGQLVPHRDVRRWLKANAHVGQDDLKSAHGR